MNKQVKRKEFYKNVKFKDKDSKKYLRDPIYYFAMQTDGLFTEFKNITNYVSHATCKRHMASGKEFSVAYPVTISGTSISNIQIEDAKGNIFNISLVPPNKVIYFENDENCMNCFIATLQAKKGEKRFYAKKICYQIEDLTF